MDVLVGVALWSAPPVVKFPALALAMGARKVVRARKARALEGRGAGAGSGVDVRWSDVRMTLRDKKTGVERDVLRDVSGEAQRGRLLAIMGAEWRGEVVVVECVGESGAGE